MIKNLKSCLFDKKGMTLVELLTAMTILALVIMCFAPLMLSYLNGINISGDILMGVYNEQSKMEVLLSGDVQNDGYTVSLDTIPLTLTSPLTKINDVDCEESTYTAAVSAYGLVSSGKDNFKDGYKTFYTDRYGSSSGIKLFPSTLTDDFKEAYITIYGNGIKFELSECELVATGQTEEIPLVNGTDYKFEYHPDRKNASDTNLLLLTVYGGGNISFENSPLVFKHYGQSYEIQVDAPSMIMVGEQAPDSNYYYYVSRGELETQGNNDYLLIHQREMDGIDQKTGDPITLNAAMNDVEWVPATDGDSEAIDDDNNSYGYYIMGGDNGQVRRFWKGDKRKVTTTKADGTVQEVELDGNYYWGGDYTYYTDISLDRVTDGSNSTYQYYKTSGADDDDTGRTYSTNTSYKFLVKRGIENNAVNGFKMVEHYKNFLSSLNMFTVTAINDRARIYASDGKLFSYDVDDNWATASDMNNRGRLYPVATSSSGSPNKTSAQMLEIVAGRGGDSNTNSINGVTVHDLDRIARFNTTNEDYAWLRVNKDSYFNINNYTVPSGITEDSYPITITSVGAIVINNYTDMADPGQIEKKSSLLAEYEEKTLPQYASDPSLHNHDASSYHDGNASMDFTYPKETYMLYCGYIPGVMDIWSQEYSQLDSDKYWAPGMVTAEANRNNSQAEDAGSAKEKIPWQNSWSTISTGSGITRQDSTMATSDTEFAPLWRATLGIAPQGTTTTGTAQAAYMGWTGNNANKGIFSGDKADTYVMAYMIQYPYTNLSYAVTGKYYDSNTSMSLRGTYNNSTLINNIINNDRGNATFTNNKQLNQTGGRVVDITFSYYSHPMALHIAANPSDDISYDQSNDKTADKVLYWNNRRETTTVLDVASTWVPSGETDIPVSLAVGYTMGGMVEVFGGSATNKADDMFCNTIMNNGIVFLRSGESTITRQTAGNSYTTEYVCKDNTGYQLNKESNYFHQFYYLNSLTLSSDGNAPKAEKHIGNLYGANFWQNNRHIDFVSMRGGSPTYSSSNSEYLRCHPMSNTKVTCATWGNSWVGNPVAMWGTERGDLLSWKCEIIDDNGDGDTVTTCSGETFNTGRTDHTSSNHSAAHNDRSVVAEFQSYKWVDNINGRTFKVKEDGTYNLTVGSQGVSFNTSNAGAKGSNYMELFDACSRIAGTQYTNLDVVKNVGFISTLENINDVAYNDDMWVACGDQNAKGKGPADYCSEGCFEKGNKSEGTNFVARPYISADNYQKTTTSKSDGQGGSWINVNYWIDYEGTGKHEQDNRLYQWSAVQISEEENCNIVQVNNVNGMWIATGYKDANKNGEYDNTKDYKEEARIFWTYDPRVPCGVEGGWSSKVRLYDGKELLCEDNGSNSKLTKMGGINSCATRD